MKPEDHILFEAYLNQKLSDTEKRDFEKRLDAEPSLKAEFDHFKEVHNVLKNNFSEERKTFISDLKEIDKSFKYQNKTQSKDKLISFKPWHYAVAASVLIIIGLFALDFNSTPQYSDFATHPDIALSVRSAEHIVSKEAEKAFQNRDYIGAIKFFDQLLKENPDQTDIQFYKGIALTETAQYQAADTVFKNIAQGNSVYASKAIWRRALNQLKQKNYKATEKLLKTIKPDASEYKKAQDLLEKL